MNRANIPPEPSPPAQRALAAFRAQELLPHEAKVALRDRIDASLAAPVQPHTRVPIDIARSAWRIGVALAAAATVLLAIRLASTSTTAQRDAAPASDEQAIYGSRSDDAQDSTHARAEPSESTAPEPMPETPAANPSKPLADERPPRRRPDARPAPTRPAPPTGPDDLSEELAMMQRARAALRHGTPEQALRILQEHAERFSAGQMLEDREALRVQALCDAGHAERASEAARRFALAHPGSPHVARVKTICTKP